MAVVETSGDEARSCLGEVQMKSRDGGWAAAARVFESKTQVPVRRETCLEGIFSFQEWKP